MQPATHQRSVLAVTAIALTAIFAGCATSGSPCTDNDQDGFTTCEGECADFDADVNPAATEVCADGVDNDCDANTPDRYDNDNDGADCSVDCDDSTTSTSPDSPELCGDGVDNDCNPLTPDLFDNDNDGFRCDMECDDDDGTAFPGGTEICNDGVDNDCDPATLDRFDGDMDGATCDVDCNDGDGTIYPGAAEICADGIDNDCDANTPDIFDGDMDGSACDVDCNDGDGTIYPGAVEACNDAIDNDCDAGTPDIFDGDMDGSTCDADCNDSDPTIYPGNTEVCADGIDNDCDANTPDIFDGDMDGATCDVDCDDGNAVCSLDCTPCQVLFEEDFEDGDFVGWTNGPGSYTRVVQSGGADGSTMELRMTGGTGNSHYNGLSRGFANLTPSEVSFWVKSGSTSTSDSYVVIGGTPIGTGNTAVFFYMKGDGLMGCFDGNVVQGSMGYSANTWYHVQLFIDWGAQRFDYMVDGVMRATNVGFRGSAPTLQSFHMYNYTPNSTGHWDEIKFYP